MTSAVKYRDENGSGNVTENHIVYMLSNANSVQSNGTNVALFSTGIYKGHGFSVTPNNFQRAVTLFSARKLVLPNWLNEKDEYFAPNKNHLDFEQFYVDSIVYSLFNNSSEQSALSSIQYQNQNWDISNEFFWMSNNEIVELAGQSFNHEMMEQIGQPNRFVLGERWCASSSTNRLGVSCGHMV
jgi:predicted heme/steroid binding protein